MLKIKAEKMKDLEKFGFVDYEYRYGRDIDNQWIIIVTKRTRRIANWNYVYGNYKKDIKSYIQDLIKADMVEVVEDD